MSGCAYKRTKYARFGGHASVALSTLSLQGKHKPAGKRKFEIGARPHIKSGRKGVATPCRAGLIDSLDDLVSAATTHEAEATGCAGRVENPRR